MKNLILLVCLLPNLIFASLEENFKTPQSNIKPGIYWYWINDNISKDGAIKDLEAMAQMNIGTVFIGNIGSQKGSRGNVSFLSPDWWDTLHSSLKKASELGIDIGIFNSPGWSQSGGPWINHQNSMRYLSSSEIHASGGKK